MHRLVQIASAGHDAARGQTVVNLAGGEDADEALLTLALAKRATSPSTMRVMSSRTVSGSPSGRKQALGFLQALHNDGQAFMIRQK